MYYNIHNSILQKNVKKARNTIDNISHSCGFANKNEHILYICKRPARLSAFLPYQVPENTNPRRIYIIQILSGTSKKRALLLQCSFFGGTGQI